MQDSNANPTPEASTGRDRRRNRRPSNADY
jgi:hypothetical protein